MIIKANGSLKCGLRLHNEMATSLINAPINLFHDKTPKGRLFNRLSKDIEQIQRSQHTFGYLTYCVVNFICCIVVCIINQYMSIIFMVFMFIIGGYITKFYISASRDLTRMQSIARSPILNTLNEALPGTITIRAYKFEQNYMNKYNQKIDELYKIQLFLSGSYNWFGITLDILVFLFMAFLIIFVIIFKNDFSPQSIGLILMYCPRLQYALFGLLNTIGLFSNDMVSMERCLALTKVESEINLDGGFENSEDRVSLSQEQESVDSKDKAFPSWPTEGKIEFKEYSVRYRPDTELVLKNINVIFKGKEKIGIVGRTGSGKSTICLALFRLLEPTSGEILIDGVDITEVGLRLLREQLTIIPQDPSLVKGTLRYNIDPLNLRSDEEIEEVLRSIKLSYISEEKEGLSMMVIKL